MRQFIISINSYIKKKNYMKIMMFFVILCVIITLTRQVVEFIHLQKKINTVSPVVIVKQETKLLKTADFSSLFGKALIEESDFIPKSSLNLKLKGVLVDKGQQLSVVIVESNDGDVLYKKEDLLPGGAILKEIHTNYIVIDNAGKIQKISFNAKNYNMPLQQFSESPTIEEESYVNAKQIREKKTLNNNADKLSTPINSKM